MLKVTAAALAALLPFAAAHAANFKVGLVMPLTGPSGDVGKIWVEGARTAIEIVNSHGGIGGMTAEAVVCDSQSQEQQAVLCAQKLMKQDQVNILLGSGSTPQTIAILPAVEDVGVPFFSVAAGTNTYRPLKKWVFKGIYGNEDQIPMEMEFLKRHGWTRAALIRDNGPFGADNAKLVKKYAAPLGIKVITDEVYSPGDTDMSAQITHIRSVKPDVILNLAITAPAGALIAKRARQLGIKAPILVGSNLQTKAFVRLLGSATNNVYFAASKVVLPTIPKSDPLHDNLVEFAKAFKKVNPGEPLTSLTINTADPVLLTAYVSKSLGARALDRGDLLKALESVHDWPGLQGIWTLSPTKHEVSMEAGLVEVEYKNDQWVAAP